MADAVRADVRAAPDEDDPQCLQQTAEATCGGERGVVVRFSQQKGYGFVLADDGTQVFVHHTEIVTDARWRILRPGQAVPYQRVTDPRGVRARGVRLRPPAGTASTGQDGHSQPQPSTPPADKLAPTARPSCRPARHRTDSAPRDKITPDHEKAGEQSGG